ncbi:MULTISPECIES: flagellar basal-body MS-ring/collar protein FliF [Marinobacterium]|jgi:flagellar M-ring protein FliF|uniref:flagellar basal-body MS-ring/collar protein FliF n=1 Tax=Marinobacterium TaxID=48075 RepID=UPI001A8F1A85|nr:flagellar basal-body MS-ring/collar protein FliF [Marinobacterium iners]QSR33910.1 flagellar M-ring protein FliF [Marinobacterium iners]
MDNTPAQLNSKGSLMTGFNSLGILRQLGLMVGLAASIAIGFAVVLWSQKPDYRVLFSNLNFSDANEVIEQLRLYNMPYKFDADGRAILVPQEHVHQARLKLAAEGFTADKTVGFELLEQEQGLGTSQFMENARFRRGLEGELARTISSLLAVRSARVHLALPKESVFVRDQRKPRASVFIEMFSGRTLERDQVAAIANLVASSIPELAVDDVTVVDQKGRLLNTRSQDQDVVLAAKQLEYTRSIEETLLNRVNSILQPVVGLGNFRAEVSTDIDFTEVEQADEIYNPDLPALRSEQTLEENRASGDLAQGVPGALSNQPPGPNSVPEEMDANAAARGGAARSGSSREQAVRNYELDRTLSYTRHQSGVVKRLSVAVVVDDLQTINPESGETVRTPWTEAELERLQVLVRNAVGFSALRGDSVTVVNSPFVPPEQFEVEESSFWQEDWFWDLMKQLMAGLFVLLLILGVLRPILRSLADAGKGREVATLGPAGEISADLEGLDGAGVADDKVTLGSSDRGVMPTPNESFDYQLNAIRSMVAEDPEKVAQAVRQWVIDHER